MAVYRLAGGNGYAERFIQTAPQARPIIRVPWACKVITSPMSRAEANVQIRAARKLGAVTIVGR